MRLAVLLDERLHEVDGEDAARALRQLTREASTRERCVCVCVCVCASGACVCMCVTVCVYAVQSDP